MCKSTYAGLGLEVIVRYDRMPGTERMLMDSVYNALMDIYLVFLALSSFMSLQMPLKKRIGLCCMMGGGGAM
jgi:hypothetical protein